MCLRFPNLPALTLSAFAALAFGWTTLAHAGGDEAHSELYRLTESGLGLVTKGVGSPW